MRKWMIIFLGLLSIGVFSACENKSDQQLHAITSTDTDRFIQHGQTTKEDILGFLGHDFTVELDAQDREKWVYSHAKASPMARNFIPYNLFSHGFHLKQTDITVVFDENDIVINHYFHRYEDKMVMGL